MKGERQLFSPSVSDAARNGRAAEEMHARDEWFSARGAHILRESVHLPNQPIGLPERSTHTLLMCV